MAEIILAQADRPGCVQLSGITAITIRHFPGDSSACAAVQAQGLSWPEMPDALTGTDPCIAWRSPREVIAFGSQPKSLHSLLQTLAPGHSPTAVAADLSEALAVIELHGPSLDVWLAHLVDAAAIPHQTGQVTRCRLAEAAVMLLRFEAQRLWLVVDKSIAPYIHAWLVYAHQGAFASSTSTS